MDCANEIVIIMPANSRLLQGDIVTRSGKGFLRCLSWLLFASCVTLAPLVSAQPSANASGTPLIPRSVLFGNPDRSSPQISPDGSWLTYLAPVDGVMNVWVAPTQDLSKARAVTQDRKRGIRQYQWAFTNQHILYTQDKD